MNLVYVEESRNLLHLIYVGTLDKAAAKQLLDAVKTVLVRLRPGFDILADFRDLKVVEKDAVKIIDELMDLLNARGVGKIVRVLPDESENFGFAIMAFFHYAHDVCFETCLNLEEALARLAIPRKNSNNMPASIHQSTDGSPQPPG